MMRVIGVQPMAAVGWPRELYRDQCVPIPMTVNGTHVDLKKTEVRMSEHVAFRHIDCWWRPSQWMLSASHVDYFGISMCQSPWQLMGPRRTKQVRKIRMREHRALRHTNYWWLNTRALASCVCIIYGYIRLTGQGSLAVGCSSISFISLFLYHTIISYF